MSRFSQVFPPAPSFTEKQLPDLTGKVYLITGAASGLGQELAGLLYSHNATVFLGTRSQSKAATTIKSIKASHPDSNGRLVSILIDFADLASVKSGAEAFLCHPDSAGKLHVLFHNAGILAPPKGSVTKEGYELALGTHAIGPQLLTRLLESTLKETAKSEQKNTVRVVWVASTGASLAPKGGLDVNDLADHNKNPITKYNISKVGTMFLCGLWAERLKSNGIVNVVSHQKKKRDLQHQETDERPQALDPGNLKTNLQQTFSQEVSRIGASILQLFLYPSIKGAYTELFAGFSPEVTVEKGCDHSLWIFPFGRLVKFPRGDIIAGFSNESDGGTGNAQEFWDWCEAQIQEYL